MEDPRLSLNYDVRGPGPGGDRAEADSGHPACVSQLCDDWRGVSGSSRLQTHVRRTGTGSPEWRLDVPFAPPRLAIGAVVPRSPAWIELAA